MELNILKSILDIYNKLSDITSIVVRNQEKINELLRERDVDKKLVEIRINEINDTIESLNNTINQSVGNINDLQGRISLNNSLFDEKLDIKDDKILNKISSTFYYKALQLQKQHDSSDDNKLNIVLDFIDEYKNDVSTVKIMLSKYRELDIFEYNNLPDDGKSRNNKIVNHGDRMINVTYPLIHVSETYCLYHKNIHCCKTNILEGSNDNLNNFDYHDNCNYKNIDELVKKINSLKQKVINENFKCRNIILNIVFEGNSEKKSINLFYDFDKCMISFQNNTIHRNNLFGVYAFPDSYGSGLFGKSKSDMLKYIQTTNFTDEIIAKKLRYLNSSTKYLIDNGYVEMKEYTDIWEKRCSIIRFHEHDGNRITVHSGIPIILPMDSHIGQD